MKFELDGVVHEVLAADDLTWAEADAVERVTGYTMDQIVGDDTRLPTAAAQIRALPGGEGLAREDILAALAPLASPGKGGTAAVTRAMLWVSMKRDIPTLRYADLADRRVSEFRMLPDDPEPAPPDPTDPPPEAGAEPPG